MQPAVANGVRDGMTTDTTSISAAALYPPAPPQFLGWNTITAPATSFGEIYSFGDSLSDVGNVYEGTLNQVPVNSIYSDGRFSNGNIWVQDLAQNLGLPVPKASLSGGTDFAWGGAETGASPVHAANPTDLPSQLTAFLAANPHVSSTALYTVWAGSNDVLDIANSAETSAQQQASLAQVLQNEVSFIIGLVSHGAQNLVVMNLPDLAVTPYETARPASDATSGALAQEYDDGLNYYMLQIATSGAAHIDFINTFGLLQLAMSEPSAYGLTNTTQPVWTGNLTDPHSGTLNATGAAQNGYLFFDDLHPTATGHALLAGAVTQSLTGMT